MRRVVVVPLLAALILGPAVSARAAEQHPGPIPDGRLQQGILSFDGHATTGDFVGSTHALSGELIGGEDLRAVRGWVEARVDTLTTGNRRRDRDLNKSMETDLYPLMRFDLEGVSPTGQAAEGTAAILHGSLRIHGITRQVDLPATIRFRGSTAHVSSDFPLDLRAYHIGGLKKALGILKMDEHILVHVDVTFEFVSGSGR